MLLPLPVFHPFRQANMKPPIAAEPSHIESLRLETLPHYDLLGGVDLSSFRIYRCSRGRLEDTSVTLADVRCGVSRFSQKPKSKNLNASTIRATPVRGYNFTYKRYARERYLREKHVYEQSMSVGRPGRSVSTRVHLMSVHLMGVHHTGAYLSSAYNVHA